MLSLKGVFEATRAMLFNRDGSRFLTGTEPGFLTGRGVGNCSLGGLGVSQGGGGGGG